MSGATRRTVLAGAATGAGAALAVACGGGSGGGAPADALKEPVTLQLLTWLHPDYVSRKDEWAQGFTARYPTVTVDVSVGPGAIIGMEEKLQTLAVAGTPPDAYVNTRAASKFARLGLHTNLAPLIKRNKLDTRPFPKAVFEWFAEYQGEPYGLPVYMHAESPALIYNRRLFQEAGLAEPPERWGDAGWTWNAFLEAARKLTKTGPDGKLSQVGVDTLAYNLHLPNLWKAAWVSKDQQTATCDSEGMNDCYTSYFDLANRHHVMPTPTEKTDLFGTTRPFFTGRVAMSTMGSWEFGTFQKLDTVDWAYMPWPKPMQAVSVQDPGMVYLPAGSKHKEQAWLFIRWLEEGSQFATSFNWMPVIEADGTRWTREFFAGKPASRVGVLVDSLKNAVPTDPLFVVPGLEDFVSKTITPALNRVAAGEEGVKATLTSLKGPLQDALRQAPH
jgi:multiple sugar transport system substrate-binding protein